MQTVLLRPFLRGLHRLRYRRTRKKALTGLVFASIGVAVMATIYNVAYTNINPAAYSPLLSVIAEGESKGNYNAYFGNASNTDIRFTDKPLSEVLQWQSDYVRQGHKSSAVGKYQIIRPTLLGLMRELRLNPEIRFDKKLQDQLAITLLERRGARAFVEKRLTREQFATNLAREWAALPKAVGPNPSESYYAPDGLNKSQVSIEALYKAMARLEAEHIH